MHTWKAILICLAIFIVMLIIKLDREWQKDKAEHARQEWWQQKDQSKAEKAEHDATNFIGQK